MDSIKSGRGGARAGSGRPTKGKGKTTPKTFRLTDHAVVTIEARSAELGISQADVVEEWANEVWLQRDSVQEARQLLEDALSIDRKAHVSREVLREVLALLELVK